MKEYVENIWRFVDKMQWIVYFKCKGDKGVMMFININEIEVFEMMDFFSYM